jgi:hypothetical protein
MNHNLGEVILGRDFEIRSLDGIINHVTLHVGKPQIDTKTNNSSETPIWYCPYQIVGIGAEKVEVCRSDDAIAALLTSLQLAHSALKYYGRVYHKKITWLGEDDLGLPAIDENNENLPDDEFFNKFFEGDK